MRRRLGGADHRGRTGFARATVQRTKWVKGREPFARNGP